MNLVDIRERRERITTTIGEQRSRLGAHYAGLAGAARVAERGIGVIEWLKQRPLYVGGAAALLVALRPRRMIRLAGKGVAAWRAFTLVRGVLQQRGLMR
jgi:hypothetical protein